MVNKSVMKEGYAFSAAYIYAPQWTVPSRVKMMSSVKLSKEEFNPEIASRFIFFPGEDQGSVLAILRDTKETTFPKTPATGQLWRTSLQGVRSTRGGAVAPSSK